MSEVDRSVKFSFVCAAIARFEVFDLALEPLDIFPHSLGQSGSLFRRKLVRFAQRLKAPPNLVSQANRFDQTQQDGDRDAFAGDIEELLGERQLLRLPLAELDPNGQESRGTIWSNIPMGWAQTSCKPQPVGVTKCKLMGQRGLESGVDR